MARDVVDYARLGLGAAGAALTGYGCWLHYAPLGFAVAGGMLFGVALIGALRTRG